MTQSVALSARSILIAGVSAAVVGAATVTPATVPAVSQARFTAAATQLTSVTTPIENAIKNTYNFLEPWAAYGAELGQWALSFIPGLWWIAPGIDLAYFSIEPLVQAGVFAVADVIGLDFGQIWPDITTGLQQAGSNFVTYGLAWLNSLVPLPPFPPFPPLPGATVAAPAAADLAALSTAASPVARSITTPIEVGIKNTYNFAEQWVNYGVSWASYVLGLIPIVNWFTPAIPLVYNTLEPLARGGTYAFADLIGLNFAAIGPDLWNGITTSVNNAITGVLNWANIPLPPPLPGAAVAPAASMRAAAAIEPTLSAPPQAAPSEATPGNGPATDSTPAAVGTLPAAEPAAPDVAPVSENPDPIAPSITAPVTAPEVNVAADTVEAPQPARSAHRGQNAPAAAASDAAPASDGGASAKPSRGARGSR